MTLPDRNTSYMKEQFGTNSLITDYRPTKKDTLTIEDVISQLKHIVLQNIVTSEETERDLQIDSSLLGEKRGMIKCAKMTLQLLEKLK